MTEKEIFIAACGVDEDNNSKATIQIKASVLNVQNNTEEELQELTTDTPVVSIFRSYRYTMIDLQYPGSTDAEYIQSVNLLKEFSRPENSLEDDAAEIPSIILTVVPNELELEYFIVGIHGTWCLMPSEIASEIDTIRFIFDNELLHTYKFNDSELDQEQLEAEIRLEQMYNINV